MGAYNKKYFVVVEGSPYLKASKRVMSVQRKGLGAVGIEGLGSHYEGSGACP